MDKHARDWKTWANGLLSATINGAVSAVGLIAGDGFLTWWDTAQVGFSFPARVYAIVIFGGGLLGALNHFRQAPVPPIFDLDAEDE